ncbi:MAG: DedA family protein [Pseudomonadota bacterium]
MIDAAITWLEANPHWTNIIIFSVSFLESLAVVGLLVPGVIFLFTAGALVASGSINFWEVSAWGALGAVLGDGISYALGVWYKERLFQWRFFRSHQTAVHNAEQFFQRFGMLSIAIGRFVGPIRAFVPVTAGICGMSATKFYIANVLSALAWAPAYLLPGVMAGAALNSQFQQPWLTLIFVTVFVSLFVALSYLFRFRQQAKKSVYIGFLGCILGMLLVCIYAVRWGITSELYLYIQQIGAHL